MSRFLWFSVYKLWPLTWKTFHTAQPPYLSELIASYLPPRSLLSINTSLLTIPSCITLFLMDLLCFRTVYLKLSPLRSIQIGLSTLKRQLKSHLFQSAFAESCASATILALYKILCTYSQTG